MKMLKTNEKIECLSKEIENLRKEIEDTSGIFRLKIL